MKITQIKHVARPGDKISSGKKQEVKSEPEKKEAPPKEERKEGAPNLFGNP